MIFKYKQLILTTYFYSNEINDKCKEMYFSLNVLLFFRISTVIIILLLNCFEDK